ncbi:MAG: glycoside hydrolase family 95 protein, partial [Draconibacterium sp.]|nr:glycoside hydrolase family 95 protein [Draconibacterium sp.]
MKNLSFFALFSILLSQVSCSHNFTKNETELSPSNVLWYNKPAEAWSEALPVGNGRLGAMVYGGTEKETIQFNEETLWTGQPHDYAHKGAYKYFKELRQLLWEGKQDEAHKLGNEHFMSQPFGQQCYQPFGKILLDFPRNKNAIKYKRQLNLGDAVSTVSYEVDGVNYKREVFSSTPDQTIAIHVEADKKGAINFTASLNSPHSNYQVSVVGNEVILKGKANNYPKKLDFIGNPYPKSKVTFEARLKVVNKGGELVKDGNSIQIKNAKSATLYLVAATSFVNFHDISANPTERGKNYLSKLKGKSIKKI